jgi:hypothetical protein
MDQILENVHFVLESDFLAVAHLGFIYDLNCTDFVCFPMVTLLNSSECAFTQYVRIKFVMHRKRFFTWMLNHEICCPNRQILLVLYNSLAFHRPELLPRKSSQHKEPYVFVVLWTRITSVFLAHALAHCSLSYN